MSSSLNLSRFEAYLVHLEEMLRKATLSVETIRAEMGNSQFGITLEARAGIRACDEVFRAKQYIQEITASGRNEIQSVFMTHPSMDDARNSLAFTHFLSLIGTTNGLGLKNAFHDSTLDTGPSQVASYWIAGLMTHDAGLTALFCPTVNCYRRFLDRTKQSYANWDWEDRSASFCVRYGSPAAVEIDNNQPGGSANPYLVLAATVAAGIAGIRNKYPLPLPGQKDKLPRSLAEALVALENDEVLVEALGEEFVRSFICCKREYELDVLVNNSIEEELKMYSNIIL